MKIEYVTGCTCDALNIDGKRTIDMSVEELRGNILNAISKITNEATLQDILISIAEGEGEFEDLGHCEQCGDWITSYTLEI